MSFREKSAWVMVLALVVAGTDYFLDVGRVSLAMGRIAAPEGGIVLAYVISLTTLAVFGQIVISALAPKEAEASADERDRLIAAKSGSVFGHFLAVGLFGVLATYLLGPHAGDSMNGDMLFQGSLASLMIAQIAEYGAQIWFYRRGV